MAYVRVGGLQVVGTGGLVCGGVGDLLVFGTGGLVDGRIEGLWVFREGILAVCGMVVL